MMGIVKKILIGLGGFLLFVVIGLQIFHLVISANKEMKYNRVIASAEFKSLEDVLSKNDDELFVGVLPQKGYIIVEDLVIDLEKMTYGEVPSLGFYKNYYENAGTYTFESIENLLRENKINTSFDELQVIVGHMKNLNILDIDYKNNACRETYYMRKTSAMRGSEGIRRYECETERVREGFRLKKLKKNNYYLYIIE